MKKVTVQGLNYDTNELRIVSAKEIIRYIDKFRDERDKDEILDLSRIKLESENIEEKLDLKNIDFSFIDFSWSDFRNIDFRGADFSKSVLDHAKFVEVDFSKSDFTEASLFGTDLRGCNMSETNCDGTVFTSAILIGANLEGLRDTDRTVHFRMACPETGYFFGYKKCFNDRMVKLLIPADSKRCSSTTNACRCEKAITVAIMDKDKTGFYKEATSFVDGDFIYRLGEMSYADSYHEDRWLDSSHGIHFWMTFEEALGYM